MNQLYTELNNNFLFQASLSSKELFHSNMLAWILQQQNEDGEFEVFRVFIKEIAGFSIPKIYKWEEIIIEREKNNFDLILKWREGDFLKYIFIENKLKSIPTIEQLEKYNQKIKYYSNGKTKLLIDEEYVVLKRNEINHRFILTPIQSDLNFGEWVNISYENEILNFLKICTKLSFLDQYETNIKVVLKTYIHFISNLILMINQFNLGHKDSHSFLNRRYDFYSSKEITLVRKLRMHDLIFKLAHFRIANLLKLAFAENDISIRKVDSTFTNSSGITTAEIELDKGCGFFIGMQLQGNQIRYYTLSKQKALNELFAVELFRKRLWFCDHNSKQPLHGKGKRKDVYHKLSLKDDSGYRTFCEYNSGEFIYFYKTIDPSVNPYGESFKIKDIVSLFVDSFQYFIENRTEFKEVLTKIKLNNKTSCARPNL